MARTIAIETSGRVGSIALFENGQPLAERQFAHGLQHAAQIIPIIDGLCRERGWKPADVQELYLSAGPGSFTGLRIAVTLVKTWAFARGARVVAVPTVRVLVENAPADAWEVIIVLDAKRGQIFTARFERQHEHWIEREPAHLDRLADMFARAGRPVHLLGEGLPYHEQFIRLDEAGVVKCEESSWRAKATVVGRLGTEMAKRGDYAKAETLTPIYIRMAEAEEKWAAAHGPTSAT